MVKKRLTTGRRAFLLGMGTLAGTAAFAIAGKSRHLNDHIQPLDDKNRNFKVVGKASLRNRAAAKGLIYGAASKQRILSSDKKFAARFAQECGILVPEGELKWGFLRPSPDRFNFASADGMLEFANAHNMLFRGHTLVWHESLPRWFEDKVNSQNAKQILLEHISAVVGHYAGKIHSWDVVNEAIYPAHGRSDCLRKSPWLEFLGPDYIEIAFRAAAEADPQALLVYNDHRLEYDTPDQEARRTAVIRLLERLKFRGVPVHALGIQTHLWGSENRFNAKKLKAFLRDVAGLNLKILITEMDVADQKLPLDVAVRDRIVGGIYEDYLSVVLDEPAVIAVMTWGLSDRYTWLSKQRPRTDGTPVRSLPLDAQLKRKLAWNGMARAFDQAPKRQHHERR